MRTIRNTMVAAGAAVAMLALGCGAAQAGVAAAVKGWLTGEVAALVVSAVLVILGGAMGLLFAKVTATFREAGEFLVQLGNSVEDRRLTREELAALLREGRDVLRVWK